MTFTTELQSWLSLPQVETSPLPEVGKTGPSSDKLRVPSADGKPQVITFLRHCGCPFAEDTLIKLHKLASNHPTIHCTAISHSDEASSQNWLQAIHSHHPELDHSHVDILVDPERKLYGQWGLGVSSFLHVLSPAGLYGAYKIGKEKGIWNRPTESGSRWQTAGSFGVDGEGKVVWVNVAQRADEVAEFGEAVKALGGEEVKVDAL